MIRLMVALPRLLGAALLAAVAAAGLLLLLESVGVLDSSWRNDLAQSIADFAVADWPGWAVALVGVGLGALSLLLGIGLFTTARPGGRRLFVVGRSSRGGTRVRGRAVRTALRERLGEHPAVVDSRASLMRRRWRADVGVADNANLQAVDRELRDLLGEEFWASLGVEPARIDLRFALRDVVAPGASTELPEPEAEPAVAGFEEGEASQWTSARD